LERVGDGFRVDGPESAAEKREGCCGRYEGGCDYADGAGVVVAADFGVCCRPQQLANEAHRG